MKIIVNENDKLVPVDEPTDRPGTLEFTGDHRWRYHDESSISDIMIVGDKDGIIALRDACNKALEDFIDESNVGQSVVGVRQRNGRMPLTVRVAVLSAKSLGSWRTR